jgi:hypothetical protein
MLKTAIPQQQPAQPAAPAAPARAANAARSAAADAEGARLDAQLEIAAKKAALASLEAQVGGVGLDAPAIPGMSSGRIVIERDGKTIILDNPTAEQIAAVGGAGPQPPQLQAREVMTLSSMVLGTIIIVTALVLRHRRALRSAPTGAGTPQADARMARIENAVESIAVEVERISEGQRFAAKMLSEGAAQPVAAGDRRSDILQHSGEG